ncbi:GNAT family N-acetyltransferase [Ruegeria atlantica]|uniref:GNAT family N-acetyltransferase n=1 Tax=Ruegeria atlantica TaxID=81569 RepID=UPI00147EACB9|nr:GNAT family N-acetyltransferase [Ruegeria atlantica]
MIELRSPRRSELEAVTDLCMRSKAFWGYDADFMNACRTELTVTESDLSEEAIVLSVQGSEITGVVQLSFDRKTVCLEKLFVDPAYMGKGIGRCLFTWARDKSRLRQAMRLVVEADPDAVPFYTAMGCREAGNVPSGSIPGRYLPRLEFEL